MKLEVFNLTQEQQVIALFKRVFSDSEGEAEGKLIAKLVFDLLATTDKQDLIGFVALSGDKVIGSIFFSRLTLPNKKTAFILSPVAIATDEQGKGIGQKLISFGIQHMQSSGVELLFTYGDPNFYSRVGFQQISESVVKAPLTLSFPEGWLVQSLNGNIIEPIYGETYCVPALNCQDYW